MRPTAIAVQPFGRKPYCGWSFHRPWGCLQHLPVKPWGALNSSVADFVSLQYKPWLGNLAKTPDPGLGKCQPQPAFPSFTLPFPLTPNMPKVSISEAQRSKISSSLQALFSVRKITACGARGRCWATFLCSKVLPALKTKTKKQINNNNKKNPGIIF